ncbi:uncharacterized protein LOC128951638 [Oppia nitens]|uniref:uncharacterized protein LOC128951638 n=1 Tax=Oppia nitens TaxID=1686743 RepID=UPI0023D9C8F6|nr:uncharacterized protein LOC128951638 [Oppia nitens]
MSRYYIFLNDSFDSYVFRQQLSKRRVVCVLLTQFILLICCLKFLVTAIINELWIWDLLGDPNYTIANPRLVGLALSNDINSLKIIESKTISKSLAIIDLLVIVNNNNNNNNNINDPGDDLQHDPCARKSNIDSSQCLFNKLPDYDPLNKQLVYLCCVSWVANDCMATSGKVDCTADEYLTMHKILDQLIQLGNQGECKDYPYKSGIAKC